MDVQPQLHKGHKDGIPTQVKEGNERETVLAPKKWTRKNAWIG